MSIPPWHLFADDRASQERSFEALLGGAPLPPDAPVPDAFLADLVDALTAPAGADELAGLTRARAAYTALYAAQRRRGGAYRRRLSMRTSLSRPKIATALAAGVLGLGGFSAAAYAGALPDAAQQIAHSVLGAPDSHPGKSADHAPQPAGSPTATPTPAGPDATGAAAFGLCNAYAHAGDMAHENSVAFANLAAAAGGADQVEAYCAAIAHPGSAAASHPAGKPTALPTHPTGRPSALPSHPVGPPSTVPAHPTGKPSALPTHPTGKPTALPSHPTGQPSTVPGATDHPSGRPSVVPPSPSHPNGS